MVHTCPTLIHYRRGLSDEPVRQCAQKVIVVQRFNPPAREYLQASRQLEDLTDEEALQRLLVAAIQTEDMAAFASHLTDELSDDGRLPANE